MHVLRGVAPPWKSVWQWWDGGDRADGVVKGDTAQSVFFSPPICDCSFQIKHDQLFLFEEFKLSAAFYAGRVRANVISTAIKQMKIVMELIARGSVYYLCAGVNCSSVEVLVALGAPPIPARPRCRES